MNAIIRERQPFQVCYGKSILKRIVGIDQCLVGSAVAGIRHSRHAGSTRDGDGVSDIAARQVISQDIPNSGRIPELERQEIGMGLTDGGIAGVKTNVGTQQRIGFAVLAIDCENAP